jgi:DNA-binding SARP family transcriptional activator
MPSTYITLLGFPCIVVNDQVIKLKRRKSMVLLAYLAVAQKPVTRDFLVVFLWPEAETSVAYSSLRNILADINATALKSFLLVTNETVQLIDLDIDVRRIQANIRWLHQQIGQVPKPECLSRMQAIIDLYQGDFLESFRVNDCPEFEDWQTLRRLEYQEYVQETLYCLGTIYAEQGNNFAALPLFTRLLSMDYSNEQALCMLLHLYARNQQTEMALQHYHAFQRFLKREYNREPDAETVKLYEGVRTGKYKVV